MTKTPNLKKRESLKPRSDPSSFNADCKAIYLTLPDKAFREFISPLLRFANDRSIDPWTIDDQVIADFKNALVGYGVKDPSAFIASLIGDWNSLRCYPAFTALSPLTPPVGKREQDRLRRQELLSATVMAELDQIHDGQLKVRNSAEHTLYNRRKRFERLIEAAVAEGATINQIADLVGPGVLRPAIDRLYPGARTACKPRDIMLSDLEGFLRAATKPAQADEVARIRGKFPRAGIGLAPTSAAMIATFSQDDMIAIAGDAVAVIARLVPGSAGRKAIARGRAAIAILLVMFNTCPRRTIEAARFCGEPDGRPRPSLEGQHGNADNISLEANLPPVAIAALDHFHATLASWVGHAPRTLFDVPKGETPRSGSALSTGVRRLLEEFGYPDFTLQLLRDAVNAVALQSNEAVQLSAANGYAFDANFHYRYAALKGSDIAAQIEASFGRRRDTAIGSAS